MSHALEPLPSRGALAKLGRAGSVIVSTVGWVGVPLLAAVLLATAVHFWAPGLVSARGAGLPGSYTTERISCGQGRYGRHCSWIGTFVSDDGTVRLDNVSMPGASVGAPLPMAYPLLWNGSRDPVGLDPPGRHYDTLIGSLASGAIGLFAAVCWLVALTSVVRRRPPPRWIGAIQDFLHQREP